MKIVMLAAVLMVALPAGAMAAPQYYIPPGNSSANEYVESIPTAGGGNATTGITQPGGGTSPSGAISPATQAALTRRGRDGIQTAAFVAASAPAAPGPGHTTGRSGQGDHPASTPGSRSGSPGGGGPSAVGAVTRSLTGIGGHGGSSRALLVILILVALGAGALALRRRREG